MTDTGAGAFWSYAQADDQLDEGRVLQLAQRLQDEYALITGSELRMFVDKTSVEWGDEWRKRMENALRETTFFIPVVTPRYFTRTECRKELLTFVGQAESLGLRELVLPILYVRVPDLRDDNSDEAVALVARMQYVDWTALRVAGPDAREYREALLGLAQRLADLTTSVGERQLERERASSEEGDGEPPGLLEQVEQVKALLPDWLEVVLADPVIEAQHDATVTTYMERIEKLERAGAPRGAVFGVLMRFANDDRILADRHLQHAEIYLAKAVELDPVVHAAIRTVESYPAGRPLLDELRAGVLEAIEAIRRHKATFHGPAMQDWARGYAPMSRAMRELAETYDRSTEVVLEANALVQAWWEKLEALYGGAADSAVTAKGE